VGWIVGWKFERRLLLGSPSGFHYVLFRGAHDGDQFLLLFGGNLEFVQALPAAKQFTALISPSS
jgi:hypothetical protein